MYDWSEKLNGLNSASNYRHEALWNFISSPLLSAASSTKAVFFFKEDLKVPDKEYGQIKKGRHCNEKEWKKKYSARRKVEGGLCLFFGEVQSCHYQETYKNCL
jgi:hypothetical protein